MPATSADPSAPLPTGHRVKRTLLVLGTLLASMNIWTGAPLAAVWVGSHSAGGSQVSMTALVVVVVVLIVLEVALVWILSRLTYAYEQLVPRPEAVRRTSPWLRSMRGERDDIETQRRSLGAIERILVFTVVIGVGAFEIWFFFFSGSSIGSN